MSTLSASQFGQDSADDWDAWLVPEIDRQQAQGKRVAFRADAAFARPAINEVLEPRGVGDAIRIPANKKWELRHVKVVPRTESQETGR